MGLGAGHLAGGSMVVMGELHKHQREASRLSSVYLPIFLFSYPLFSTASSVVVFLLLNRISILSGSLTKYMVSTPSRSAASI